MGFLLEWEESCVDDELTRLNVTELEGARPLDYLLYSDQLPRRNDGRVSNQFLKRYEHTEKGGWWCSGIDILSGKEDLWGCFKPLKPRLSGEGDRQKSIKYEHPPKTPTGIFALRVPLHIWERIAKRAKIEILPQDINVQQPDLGFWHWLSQHPDVPLCITEGAKKAGALLTAGYAAIALPGINSGYRVPRDAAGNRIGKSKLIPQLQKLTQVNREVLIVFDQDTKPTTVKAVEAAIKRMGYLLAQQDCTVKVVTWKAEWGKGVDDFIATQGQAAFNDACEKALSLDTWKAHCLNRLTFVPDITLNHRYLPDFAIPQAAKLIGIKSPKGTGKTRFLETIVAQAIARQQWVLVIGHRVRLVQALCQRFGLQYITEIKDNPTGTTLGYGLCLDSLHPSSQANFQAANWSDGVVIIDEVEQVLWHGLNSSTCSDRRVAILKSLKTLMQNVLSSAGQVYVADADLSDVSLDYLLALAGIPLQPFIVNNAWQPDAKDAWQGHYYTESTPERLTADLVAHIKQGGKPFVCLSAQKLTSQWGTQTLEAYLQQHFPQKKILRIDSESLTEPDHPANDCMANLNDILPDYDIVLASPSIETGVSIDLRGHFSSVWCIAQGVQAANSVCQALGRVRENLPRYVWVASYGFNQVGNGSTSIPGLLASGQRLTQLNIRLLQQSDFDAFDDLDTGFQAESLLCWAKMAVRVNAAMLSYRDSVLGALQAEGHQLQAVPPEKQTKKKKLATAANHAKQAVADQLTIAISEVRKQNYQAECEAIALAETLTAGQFKVRKKQLVKTAPDRQSLRKFELQKRYGIPITAELVIKDDDGWYRKLRIHYYLTLGREYLAERDRAIAQKMVEQGQGSLFLPDFNRSQLGVVIGVLEILGIHQLLQEDQRELRNNDADLLAMTELAIKNRAEIKAATGVGIAQKSSPVTVARRFLELMGFRLTFVRSEGSRKERRIRVYQIDQPQDGREAVFAVWLAADEQQARDAGNDLDNDSVTLDVTAEVIGEAEEQCVQLSLRL